MNSPPVLEPILVVGLSRMFTGGTGFQIFNPWPFHAHLADLGGRIAGCAFFGGAPLFVVSKGDQQDNHNFGRGGSIKKAPS